MRVFLLTICGLIIGLNSYSQLSTTSLIKFRIEEGHASKVYFDSTEPLYGDNSVGFRISNESIIGIHVNEGFKQGHYFTIDRAFDFWDNNSIRYEGGSNLKGADSQPLSEFTLEYIQNNIPEPKGNGSEYFVDSYGSDDNDGLSPSRPWKTIQFAASNVNPGDVVYIKAGDYGGTPVSVLKNGVRDNPIKFIGYNSEPGDNPVLQRSPGTVFSPSTMPLIHSESTNGSGFSVIDRKYIIVRNIQVEGFKHTIDIAKSSYCILDNVYARGGKTAINDFPYYTSVQNRVLNSYVSNGTHNGVYMTGARHLIDNVYATSKGKPNMDYYIVIVGGNMGIGNHIIRNCEVVRDLNDTHPGHGISLKAQGRDIGYSLVEKSTIKNVGMSLEARHSGSKFNVYKDIYITNEGVSRYGKGIQITSATNSIFERIFVENKSFGIKFLGSTEDPKATDAGRENLIRNCIFRNNSVNLQIIEDLDGQNRVPKNNIIANCTFDNAGSMFLFEANEKEEQNTIVNSIIHDVKNQFHSRSKFYDFNFSYSNFFSKDKSYWSSKNQAGEGNISKDPKFINASDSNYQLQSDSPMIDQGKAFKNVTSDYLKNMRPKGRGIDMGAFEYIDESTASVEADAGEDHYICLGENVVLTSVSAESYEWSTGETTRAIEVSPNENTLYTLTVFDGNEYSSDEVMVYVMKTEVDVGPDQTIQSGESIVLTASDADSYIWSTGETQKSIEVRPTESTVYTVVVETNGCSASDEVEVKVKNDDIPQANPTVVAYAGEDKTICLGDSVTLTASGGDTFVWSTGETTKSIVVSPLETNNYEVQVSINGVSDTDVVSVFVNQDKAYAGEDVTVTSGETVELTAAGGTEFLWSTGEETKTIKVQPSESTKYTVTVKSGPCTSSDDVMVNVIIESDTNISATEPLEDEPISDSESNLFNIHLFPNPTTGIVQLQTNSVSSEIKVHVISINGKILFEDSIESSHDNYSKQIDLSQLNKGIYYMRFLNDDVQDVKKIVII